VCSSGSDDRPTGAAKTFPPLTGIMDYQGYDRDFNLTNKVALITGGAAGIGKAIATLYALKGANLILADLSPSLHDAAKQIVHDPARIESVIGNITVAGDRERIVQAGIKKFGRIDILVNNAGVALLEPALEVSESNWDKTLDLNLKAAFFLSQLVAKEMIRTGGGKIVNIGSQAGMIALERHVAYMASKAAIIGITKVLAVEWAKHNVQVNAISPTVTLTELGKKAWAGEVGEEFKRKLPAGRFADPDEIAACALFLASEAANMITGSNLVIDGGYTIQ
jgi:NAD(P)-dependent dehydrogenase (short-subunit alcohol dehydrogenase family)